jgi:hypothetical protein
MSNAIEKITTHFRDKISGKMSSVRVPEWDTTIYYKSSSTLKEQTRVIELAQKGQTVEALVETLITKARNEDGSKMFKPADKQVFLNEADPDVVIRVVGEMNSIDLDSIGDVEKN